MSSKKQQKSEQEQQAQQSQEPYITILDDLFSDTGERVASGNVRAVLPGYGEIDIYVDGKSAYGVVLARGSGGGTEKTEMLLGSGGDGDGFRVVLRRS